MNTSLNTSLNDSRPLVQAVKLEGAEIRSSQEELLEVWLVRGQQRPGSEWLRSGCRLMDPGPGRGDQAQGPGSSVARQTGRLRRAACQP